MCLPKEFSTFTPEEQAMTRAAVHDHHLTLAEAAMRAYRQSSQYDVTPAWLAYQAHIGEHKEAARQQAKEEEARKHLRVEQGVLVRIK